MAIVDGLKEAVNSTPLGTAVAMPTITVATAEHASVIAATTAVESVMRMTVVMVAASSSVAINATAADAPPLCLINFVWKIKPLPDPTP